MDVLGGLGRAMPITSIACLIGCLSLIGLPPFNGFASKWSIYASGIASSAINIVSIPIYVGVALAMFSGTLTAIYSLKFYSEIFSGEPRIDVEAGDVSAILDPRIDPRNTLHNLGSVSGDGLLSDIPSGAAHGS